MKKVVLLLVILMAVTGAMFAQSAEGIFAAIPAAAYTKSDDGAVWTFAATSLTIRDGNGSITIPIQEMRNLSAVMEGAFPGCSFAYDTAAYKRTYKFVLNGMTGDVSLTIVRDGETLPVATLKKR